MEFTGEPLTILDFDIEARPLSWYGGDWVTKEVTAIAWQFISVEGLGVCDLVAQPLPTHVMAYTGSQASAKRMLKEFTWAYDNADMVTGHFIRGYDLPVINGALAELGMPLLSPKLTLDTKNDLVKMSGLSKSQENLGAMLGLEHPKVGMSQKDWRDANRLTKSGIAKTKERVVGDVEQHVEMLRALIARDMVRAPKLWSGSPSGSGKYQP